MLNNAGLDLFRGKNLIIVGKQDRPEEFYRDLWFDIGDGTPLEKAQNTTIDWNGLRQTLHLYQEPQIQKEQLEYLEYVTNQAVGRARTLRELGCNVYLFSNYIPAGVDEVYD